MDRPRSCTDLRIAVPCDCPDMKGIVHGHPCDRCSGTGWNLKDANKLSAAELDRLQKKLTPAPP